VFGELETKEELVLKGNRGFFASVDSLKVEAGSAHYPIMLIYRSLYYIY
jgi:hypothetical protein